MNEPKVNVGILFSAEIGFELLSPYIVNGKEASGKQTVKYHDNKVQWNGELYDKLRFDPLNEKTDVFELKDGVVTRIDGSDEPIPEEVQAKLDEIDELDQKIYQSFLENRAA